MKEGFKKDFNSRLQYMAKIGKPENGNFLKFYLGVKLEGHLKVSNVQINELKKVSTHSQCPLPSIWAMKQTCNFRSNHISKSTMRRKQNSELQDIPVGSECFLRSNIKNNDSLLQIPNENQTQLN